ncbi:MAG: hypothetical protein H6523_12745 [Mycolicibacterium sp.]|nr:hypothetical protein [Mycolicibacterium sp.]
MGVPTHVMEFSSGRVTVKGSGSGLLQFVSPLKQLTGVERWFVTLSKLPAGKTYEDTSSGDLTEYIQAGGRADKMMLDIRKPGGAAWGAESVRYVIGHQGGNTPIDVPIELPSGAEYVRAAEVFGADEAGDIFFAYYTTGDIPPGYVLRPVEGYTADGGLVDLRDVAGV